jgi:hypothetical protein
MVPMIPVIHVSFIIEVVGKSASSTLCYSALRYWADERALHPFLHPLTRAIIEPKRFSLPITRQKVASLAECGAAISRRRERRI